MKKESRHQRLADRVVHALGTHENYLQEELKANLLQFYRDWPRTRLDSEVESVLLELDEKGIAEIKPGGRIILTEDGRVEYKSVLASMELKNRRKQSRKAIKLRKQETQNKKNKSLEVHERIKTELGELAYLLGKMWKPEHELVTGGPVKLDIVWYGKSSQLTHAFEVQHRGEWKNAIGNLEATKRYYPACKLFVVVHNEKEISPIQHLLGAQLNRTIKVIKVSDIDVWLTVLRNVPEGVRLKLINVADAIRQFELA